MFRAADLRDRIVASIDAVGFNAHGLVVDDGSHTATYRWTADARREIHSLAKGVCVLATGCAVDEGLIDIDAPVVRTLGVDAFGTHISSVTMRHLLTMTSGVDFPWTPTI